MPDAPGLRVIPLDQIPWAGLRDDAIRSMLRRYVHERTEDTFGVYVGDAERGTVQALAKRHRKETDMRFSLFVHMERLDPAKPHAELFAELTELVLMAEEAGFEAAWIGEHHGDGIHHRAQPVHHIWPISARRTKTIRLGTGTVIAPFWHPIKLAGEAAMTDLVTGGRLDIGIARGAYSFEYERLLPGLDAMGRRAAHARDDPGDPEPVGGRLRARRRVLVSSHRPPRRRSRCSSRIRRSGSRRAIPTRTNSPSPTAATCR